MKIAWAKDFGEKDVKEYNAWISIFFKRLMGCLSFQRDGRNMFNPHKSKNIQGIDIWPGFFSSMQRLQSGPLLQIDLANKVVRKDKLINEIRNMTQKGKNPEQVSSEMEGMSVVTSYGKTKRNYRIERIDFNQSPLSTFKKGEGEEAKEMSYMEYYQSQYEVTIKDQNQPLAISKNRRTGMEVALIPELCEMTGLTDAQRANFNLMRDLGAILHKGGKERMDEVRALMDEISEMKNAKKLMDQWKVSFDKEPLKA